MRQASRSRSSLRAIFLALLAAAAMLFSLSAVAQTSAVDAALADADAGRTVFGQCRACHDVGAGARHKSGPHLNALFGRRAGDAPGYASSMPLVAAGLRGLVWTPETLAAFLEDPRSVTPGAAMPFIGIDDPADRANLIAYLMASQPKDSAAAQ